MIFLLFFSLSIAAFFVLKNQSINYGGNVFLLRSSTLLIASLFIFLFLFPFWIFGSASAVGGYDEYHGQVTWFWIKNNFGLDTFLHTYFGGIGVKDSFNSGNEYLSLYEILLLILPQYIAGLIYKFIAILLTFIGLFRTAKEGFGLSRETAFIVSIFSISIGYVNYQFALGGNGMMIAILALSYPVFFLRKEKIEQNILFTIFLLLVVFCTNPLTFLPVFIVHYLAVLAIFYDKNKIQKLKRDSIILISVCLISILNWFYSFVILFQIFEESARVALTGPKSLYEVFREYCFEVYFFFRKEPHLSFLSLFVLFFFRDKEFLVKVIYSGLIIFFLPLVMQLISFFLDIPLVRNYRWPQLFYSFEIFFGLLIIYFLSRNIHKVNNFLFVISLAAISSYGLSTNVLNILEIRENQGGYNARSEFEILNKLSLRKEDFRVISMNYSPPPMIPIFYGLSTFDGAVTHASMRRTNFITKAILDNKEIHNHRQVFTDIEDLNLKGLSFANVKYILSSYPIIQNGIKPVSQQSEILTDLKIFPNKLQNLLEKNFLTKHLNALYIYEIEEKTFPRVFSAKKILTAKKEWKEKKYFEELLSSEIGTAYIKANDLIKQEVLKESEKLNLQILGYELENHGYKFNLKGEGLLVMNNVYRTNWSFTCNNSEKKIYPVNEIMMGVFITKGCTEGRLTYDLDY